MKKTRNMKKVLIAALSFLLLISFIGCSKPNPKPVPQDSQQSAVQNGQQGTQANTTAPNVNLQKDSTQPEKDKLLTQNLKNEKEVLDANVYTRDNVVFAAILIKDGIKEADAKQIAQKYMDELKKKYPGQKINVQAVQSGKNIADLTSN